MIQLIVNILFKQIFKAIQRKKEWKLIDKYVNKPNELDIQVKQLQKNQTKTLRYMEDFHKDLAIMQKDSHAPVFPEKAHKDIIKRLKFLEKREK